MNKTIIFSVIFGLFIGIIIGAGFWGEKHTMCVPDPTFHRVECCNKLSANGHCVVGQSVQLYNI